MRVKSDSFTRMKRLYMCKRRRFPYEKRRRFSVVTGCEFDQYSMPRRAVTPLSKGCRTQRISDT